MSAPTIADYLKIRKLQEITQKDNEALQIMVTELERRNQILAEELMRLLSLNEALEDKKFIVE